MTQISSIVLTSISPPRAGTSLDEAPSPPAKIAKVAWLSSPVNVDDLGMLGADIDQATQSPHGHGFSCEEGLLLSEPSAKIALFNAGSAQISAGAARIQELFAGCTMMSFETYEGFDLEAACAATMAAIGLRKHIPDPEADAGSPAKRI